MMLRVHENPLTDPVTAEEMAEAARVYSSTTGLRSLAERVLVDGARHGYLAADGQLKKGYTFGGEDVDGKPFGALHVYNTRPVYQMVPNREHVRDFLLDRPELPEILLFLLEKYQNDRYQKWLSGAPWNPELLRHLGQQGDDAYLTLYGDAACEVRASEPGSAQEVVEE